MSSTNAEMLYPLTSTSLCLKRQYNTVSLARKETEILSFPLKIEHFNLIAFLEVHRPKENGKKAFSNNGMNVEDYVFLLQGLLYSSVEGIPEVSRKPFILDRDI